MKKFLLWFVAVLVLFSPVVGISSDTNYDAVVTTPTGDDTYGYQMKNSSGTRLFSVTKDTGAVYTAGGLTVSGTIANSRERGFTLPLMGFILSDSSPITASTAPGIEVDDLIPNIVWADGETTPVMVTFRVPTDYSSGGAFRIIATESDSTTPNQIDFDVYVNKDGVAADSAATGQTPVALAGTAATPDVVTLTPATDFSALTAGSWVTLRIWRDNTATGTGDLEVKGVEFYYTASH